MATKKLGISEVIRPILSANIEMPADEIITAAKSQGLKAPDASIRNSIHNMRSQMRREVKPTPAAARQTQKPKAPKAAIRSVAPSLEPTTSPDLTAFLANVSLVNRVVGQCGGIENAQQVVDAVRACGGLEAFLQHLETVATIRNGKST